MTWSGTRCMTGGDQGWRNGSPGCFLLCLVTLTTLYSISEGPEMKTKIEKHGGRISTTVRDLKGYNGSFASGGALVMDPAEQQRRDALEASMPPASRCMTVVLAYPLC